MLTYAEKASLYRHRCVISSLGFLSPNCVLLPIKEFQMKCETRVLSICIYLPSFIRGRERRRWVVGVQI